jgi:hypothetical protein
MPLFHGIMVKSGPMGPFRPTVAEMVTTDKEKYFAWLDRMEGMGYVDAAQHAEFTDMLRAMSRRRQAELSKPFEPTAQDVADMRANRPSGKGQKPFRKPVRDYQGASMPKGPWTGERRVMPQGPATPQPSTKRFPHLGGQTGPQSRGE